MTSTTAPGYLNRNNQVVVRRTDIPGNDHLQYTYVLRCEQPSCGIEYGANGSDIFQRKCPRCQDGAPGLPIVSFELERPRLSDAFLAMTEAA